MRANVVSRIAFVLVAAGQGLRAGGLVPKQDRVLAGRSMLSRSLDTLTLSVPDARVAIVARPEAHDSVRSIAGPNHNVMVTFGGPSRQSSVLRGLEALAAASPSFVLIHDAARPLVTADVVKRVLGALEGGIADGVAPAVPVTDSLRRNAGQGDAGSPVPRDGLHAIQTPQGFNFEAILAAHRAAPADQFSDDLSLAQAAGIHCMLVPGDFENFKVTLPEDFVTAERLIMARLSDVRTGQGFDVHAFSDGDHVMLCGVRVPYSSGLSGHSDADVALHALTDAMLGALGEGDIGVHFPPTDPQWCGASSDQFLIFARDRVLARGGVISHVDLTIICEAPKISPHRSAMVASLSAILGLPSDRVSVKATTTEGLGFSGRREGIAAMAVATIRVP